MKKIISNRLLNELQAEVRAMMDGIHRLQQEDPEHLVQAPAPGKWSAAQVLAHLVSYGDYYLPAIQKAMEKESAPSMLFKPGPIGNYFTLLMQAAPDGTARKKMKAPKQHRPAPDTDWYPVKEKFLQQQKVLLELLETAQHRNIGSTRVPISLTRFIRLKLGDTFRFLVAHEHRHFMQLQRAVAACRQNGLAAADANQLQSLAAGG